MRKLLKGLVISVAVTALAGVFLSTAYTRSVEDKLTDLRRESRSDIVYLRTRIRELESELTACLLEQTTPPDQPVGGVIDETEEVTTEPDTDVDTEGESEEVTVPTHHAPETQEPSVESVETETASAMYLLTVYNGVIGVYDASGELVRTVNCFVMTLPEAEREALEIGIPAYSYEEMCALIGQYE